MGEQRHPWRRRALKWLLVTLVFLTVLGTAAQKRFDIGDRLGIDVGSWTFTKGQPATVEPPRGLHLPDQQEAAAVAAPVVGARISGSAVQQVVARYLTRPALVNHLAVVVADLGGAIVQRSGSGTFTPASTLKILTSVAALESVGPMTQFTTDVRQVPGRGGIVLVGGGDPYLTSTPAKSKGMYPARASLEQLANQTARALKAQGATAVALSYDDSLFSGPAVSPQWPSSYISQNVVPPITALWADQGHNPTGYGFVSDPSATAAAIFAAQLRARGITVTGTPARTVAPVDAASIAHVSSAPLGEIVQRLLSTSDNNAAEVVSRQVGLAVSREGSFTAGAAGTRTVLRNLGVTETGMSTYDGSGLSRYDRLDPATLIGALAAAASPAHPRLREVITGLSVAGYSGSLANRFDRGAAFARGRVYAKTGTLTGVHGLAGIATDRDGAPMIFVALADRVPVPKTLGARLAIDQLAAALADCACSPTT